ncbi:ATP-dependent DNA helicase, partial [Aphis craccivora]
MKNIIEEKEAVFFLDASGGTGKTFLLNLILAEARKSGNIANNLFVILLIILQHANYLNKSIKGIKISTKNGLQLKRQDIILIDDSQSKISLTLWSDQINDFEGEK